MTNRDLLNRLKIQVNVPNVRERARASIFLAFSPLPAIDELTSGWHAGNVNWPTTPILGGYREELMESYTEER